MASRTSPIPRKYIFFLRGGCLPCFTHRSQRGSTAINTMTLKECNSTEEEKMKRALFAMVLATAAATPAFADLALAQAKNCLACHAVDKKLVGPAYKDVAAKYA